MQIPFIKYSKVWFAISGALVIAAVAALSVWGLKFGIEFTGGSLVEFQFSQNRPATEDVQNTLRTIGLSESIVQHSGDNGVIVRTNFLSEEDHQTLVSKFRQSYQTGSVTVEETRFETIGSVVSEQLRSRSIWAIIWVNVAIIAYIAYTFRKVSQPVASWKYGALAIIALLHDILIVMGVFAVLGRFTGVEVQTDFILALLTILGFSVTDTIVVYDRVRENVLRHTSSNFGELVNVALNETLFRSVNTTLTTLLPLFAIFFFGGESLHNFSLALLIGMACGTYSSIFIASPLLVYVEQWQRRKTKTA